MDEQGYERYKQLIARLDATSIQWRPHVYNIADLDTRTVIFCQLLGATDPWHALNLDLDLDTIIEGNVGYPTGLTAPLQLD